MKLEKYVDNALDTTVWRSYLEIRYRVMDAAIGDRNWGPVSYLVSRFSVEKAAEWMRLWRWPAKIYAVIEELEQAGFVEKRMRDITLEVRARRNGVDKPEYRLTVAGGKRRRSVMPMLSPAVLVSVA